MSQELHQTQQVEPMDIIERFKTLQSKTITSLKKQKVSSQSLLDNLPHLGISLSVSSSDEAIEYVLINHCSFFNFHLIEHVIDGLGTERDKANLSEYKRDFTVYGNCDVCECPSEVSPLYSDIDLIELFMIFAPGKTYNISDLHIFYNKFRNILNICSSTILNLCRIEEMKSGSLKLTFQIPLSVIHEMFPPSTEQEAIMASEGIDHLWLLYQFNRQKYQAELENKGEISCLSTKDLSVLLKDAWEARTVWYNLGLELGLISSDLDAIKKKEHGDVDDCFREMLKLRLSFGTLQWSHLITALRQDPVNLAIVANNLAKIHEPDMVKEPLTGITSILLDEDQPKNPPAATQADLNDEFVDSKYTIKQELKIVKEKFVTLLFEIRKRLNSIKIPTKKIVTSVTEYAEQFKGDRKISQLLIAEHDQQKLDSAFSIDDVFKILSKYWSFLEHQVLVNIVNQYGDRKIKEKVKEYQRELKQFFLKRKIAELPKPFQCSDNTELSETHEPIMIKLNQNDPSWSDIIELKEKICAVLDVVPSTLQIYRIEEGCIKVTFYIPRQLAQEIFKKSLKPEQLKALNATSVMTLSVMRESIIFTNELYKDHAMSAELEAINEFKSSTSVTDTKESFSGDFIESDIKVETNIMTGQKAMITTRSKAASMTGDSDSGIGTMARSTIADEIDEDDTLSQVDEDQDEPYLRMLEVDTSKLLPPDHSSNLSLHQASLRGNLNEVKRLTENLKYNPLHRDENGNTALHYAARGGDVNVMKYFIQDRQCSSGYRNKVGLTPLHTAALCCCLEIIKYLTEEGKMELLDTDKEGFTPLHRACSGGDLTVVRYLVNEMRRSGTEIKDIVYSKTNSGDYPIHCASREGHLNVIKFFMSELNCNPSVKGRWDKTPLQYAAQGGHLNTVKYLIEQEKCEYSSDKDIPLHFAVEHGHLHVLKYLTTIVQYNPLSKNTDGRTCLSSAALKGHLKVVKFITLDLKCDPNIPDKDGKLPLHAATEGGHLDITKYFIEDLACDPSHSTRDDKETPLHLAAEKGHLDIVKYLTMEMNCSLSCRNSNGDTPLNLAALYGHQNVLKFFISELMSDPNTPGQYDRTPLHSAAQEGYLDMVKYLIDDQKCDPSCSTGKHKVTPLHLAAKYGHLHVVKYLTQEQHCDPLSQNIAGESPLTCSAIKGHIKVIEYFIKELKCNPNAPGPQNRTALHIAAENGHLDVVQYLIKECCCDPSSCHNDDKVTPLHLAALDGHVHVVKYLTEVKNCNPQSGDKWPYTPLHYAALNGHLEVVKFFIEECMCSPNIIGYDESTPLKLAHNAGHNLVVKYLSRKSDELHSTV